MMSNSKTDQLALRLPEGLRDRIKISAVQNRRSMNAELIVQLERLYPAATEEALAAEGRG